MRIASTTIALALGLIASVSPLVAQERSPHANYVLRCAGCHGMEGAGVPDAGIPDFVDQVGAFTAVDEGRTYLMHVPGIVGSGLSDAEIADVINYVMDLWAGPSLPDHYEPFTADEVAERRAVAVEDVVDKRREVAALLQAMGISTAQYPWP